MYENKISLYMIDNNEKDKIKQSALEIIKKSKHFDFFVLNLYNYSAINIYQGFSSFDKYHDIKNYEYDTKLSYQITYLCLFVTTCILEDYGDCSCEFENDLGALIYNINYIKKYKLSKVFCEIKYFLLAYKILCQADSKIKAHTDLEYWMCDLNTQNHKREWYSYYLPVNLDNQSSNFPTIANIQKAREIMR